MKKSCVLFILSLCLSTITHGHDANHNTKLSITSEKAQPTIQVTVRKLADHDTNKRVQIQLSDLKSGKPINPDNLKEAHTQKVHLLIIDDSLEDYSHVHPKSVNDDGLYEFEWTPKKQANYRLWADLHPLTTDTQEYVIADLVSDSKNSGIINRSLSMESSVDDYTARLSFEDSSLKVGQATMGKIVIMDAKGDPVKDLEPIMGAYAHIVGFSEDLKTIVHIHPMGKEPSQPSDRGGPELQFHIEPTSSGFIKLFAQIKIKGKELFFPFGITIN